jgi:hypothetical protein
VRGCDSTLAGIAVIAVAVMGPVGALGTLALAFSLAAGGNDAAAASTGDWHEKLARPVTSDPARELAQAIEEGRLPGPGERQVRSFSEIARSGSVGERQTMLGIISQRFDPAFSGVLRRELTSAEAAVRVSAAAVFTKLRDRNRIAMGAGRPLPDILPPGEAQERGLALARGVMSGLLDPADLEAARSEAIDLLLLARPRAETADPLEEVIATLLFEAGRLGELQARLAAIDTSGSPLLRSLHARLLMRAGRTMEAAEVLRHGQDNSVRLNAARRIESDRALLAQRHGEAS